MTEKKDHQTRVVRSEGEEQNPDSELPLPEASRAATVARATTTASTATKGSVSMLSLSSSPNAGSDVDAVSTAW